MNLKKCALILILLSFVSACQNIRKIMSNKGTILTAQVMSDSEEATDQTIVILQNRLNNFDVAADVSKTGAHEIEIKIYEVDVDEIERLKKIFLNVGKLEFKKVYTPQNSGTFTTFPTEEAGKQSAGGKIPDDLQLLPFSKFDEKQDSGKWIFVEKASIISNGDLKTTTPYQGADGSYQINFTLKPDGAAKFGEWTRTHIGSYLAIVLNDEIKSAPVIKGPISDQGQIDGRFTKEAATDLSMVMHSGAMPAALKLTAEKPFGQ